MTIYELSEGGRLEQIPKTTFAAQQVLERADLQRALRKDISAIGETWRMLALIRTQGHVKVSADSSSRHPCLS